VTRRSAHISLARAPPSHCAAPLHPPTRSPTPLRSPEPAQTPRHTGRHAPPPAAPRSRRPPRRRSPPGSRVDYPANTMAAGKKKYARDNTMRIVAGKQNTRYVISSRPSSLARLTSGTIMTSASELEMRITDTTTVADVFRYIKEHSDEIDAKVSAAHPQGKRSVKHGFLICYESSKSPAFQIITKSHSKLISNLDIVPYIQQSDGWAVGVEPTIYVFARAPGEGKANWYISKTLQSMLLPRPRQTSNTPSRPANLTMYPVGTVLKSWGAPARFEGQFVRVTKHIGDSKMQARRLQTAVTAVTFEHRKELPPPSRPGSSKHTKTIKHTSYMPTNILVPGRAPIDLVAPSKVYNGIPVRWVSSYYKEKVQWTPTLSPIKKSEILYSSMNPRHVNAVKRIGRALWRRVQAKSQMNALAPGGSTAQAAINRAKRTASS